MVEALIRHPQAGINDMIIEVGQATDFTNILRIVDDFPDTAHWQWMATSSQGTSVLHFDEPDYPKSELEPLSCRPD